MHLYIFVNLRKLLDNMFHPLHKCMLFSFFKHKIYRTDVKSMVAKATV